MKKWHVLVLLALVSLFVSAPVWAAEAAGGTSAGPLGIGLGLLGLGLGVAGAGLGQGVAANSALNGAARNPGASDRIQLMLLISLAFMESLVIFTFALVYLRTG